MTTSLDPVLVRALKIISNHFWGEHVDCATHHTLSLWLEGLPDPNAAVLALLEQGYLYGQFHELDASHGYHAYHLSELARETIRAHLPKSEVSALNLLPMKSYLRKPFSYRVTRHLVQVVHSVVGADSASVERLRFSHPQFGDRSMLEELSDLDRQIAEASLNALLSSFLRSAVHYGLMIEMTPGQYQKTTRGFQFATNQQLA